MASTPLNWLSECLEEKFDVRLAKYRREPFDQEYRLVAKDGRVVWMHSQAVLVTDESGSPRFWHGVALDITARKEAEENLRELEDRYQAVLGRLGPEADPA